MATVEVGVYSEEEDDEVDSGPEPWGWLFPQNKGFAAQDLVKEEYKFGRGEECDHCFHLQNGRTKVPHFLALSNLHFRIYMDNKTDSDHIVIIEDKSSNGTFINGEKIGKNKKQVLNTDDEISLSFKTNKAYIFYNVGSTGAASQPLPQAFKDKYVLSKSLGRGMCGEVKLVFQKETCNKFAVKIVSKKAFSVGPMLGRAAIEEGEILKGIQHPCIIRVQDIFDTPNTLYIVLELAEGGELFDRVVRDGSFSENIAKLFFYQLLVAVKYLHDRGITHRDIKPENILLANNDVETLIKVTDFGLSRFVGENSLMKTLCGTPCYLAPEILLSAGTGGYSKAIDLWSMGVILFIMLAGYPPFSAEKLDHSLNNQIVHARYSFPSEYWGGVSADAMEMVRRLLTLDPEQRITVTEALAHPWLQDEEVLAKAHRLMEAHSPTPATIPSRKRPASFEDPSTTTPASPPEENPAKRLHLMEPSPPTSKSVTASPKSSTPTSKCNTPSPTSTTSNNGTSKHSSLSTKTSIASEED